MEEAVVVWLWRSLEEARQLGHNYIGPEHLLLGLLREGEGVAARVLENLAVDASNIRMQLYCEKEKLSDDQFLVTCGAKTCDIEHM